MVLVNISSLAGTISLKMHILIVSNESRLKRDGIDHFDQFGHKKGPKRARQAILRQNIPIFIILFKHRHVTPRWKSFGLRIKKKYFYAYFDLLGPKKGQKGAKMQFLVLGPKIWWGLTPAEGL